MNKIEQKRRRANEGRGERRRRGVQTEKENREMREQYKNTSSFFIIELVCIFLELKKKIYIYLKLVKKGEENVTNIESPEIKSKP